MALAEVCVRVLDDIGAFAGSVSDEEDGALLQVFGKAVFVYYDRCGFCDLDAVRGEYCRVHFHSAGVNHRDYEEGIPDLVGDDGQAAGGGVEGVVGGDNRIRVDVEGAVGDGLSYQSVEGADGKERLVRAEAEALGGGYTYAQACV